jgi:Domain of unknown function (DUF5666)
MSHPVPSPLLQRLRLAAAALLLALAACGGGVETGGTGPTGSSYVEGPITGFGSVIVGGIRFDDSAARVEDSDGRLRDRSELRLGMRVEVDAGAIAVAGDGTRSATAARVRIAADLLGPVTSVDAAGASFSLLGQTVRVGMFTVVDGVPGGFSALTAGDIVEVHGFIDPGLLIDRYVATRIERRSVTPGTWRVRGLVRGLDTAARTLRIGTQTFDLSTVGVPAGLANGQIVRLSLPTTAAAPWPVSAIAVESRRLDDRDEAELEGIVTAFSSTARFAVNGISVDAAGATFPDGTAGIVPGARVKVEGRAAGGELVAREVELRNDDEVFGDGFDLRDAIAGLDTGATTFSVRGVTVFYGTNPPPRFDDGTVADLANGRRVRVRAQLSPDRTRVVATRIEFEN